MPSFNFDQVSDYKHLFEASPELILFLEPSGVVVDINKRVKDWLGYNPKDFVGKSVFRLPIFSKETLNIMKENFSKRLKGQKILPYNVDFFAKNKKIESGRVTAKILKDKENKVFGLLVMVSNVTKLKEELEKEHLLSLESEKKFHGLFENMRIGGVIYKAVENGRNFVIKDFNKAAEKIENIKREKVIGKKVTTVFPGIKKFTLFKTFQKVNKTGKPKQHPVTLYKDKRISGWRDNYVYKLSTGEIVAIYDDLTKEKQAEEDLKKSEAKFKTVVTNAQAIIFMLDKKGIFLLSEGRKLSLLGIKPGQVVDQSAFEIYKDYPEVIFGIKQALSGKMYSGIILVQDVYFDTLFSPNKNEKGEIESVIGMAIDVTKEQEAKLKLQEVEKMKTEFMSIAAHQLRSPLGSMRWNLELLLAQSKLKEHKELHKRVEETYKSNKRVISLVNDLLNVSRIEQGRIKNAPQDVKVLEVITEVLRELESEISLKKISFSFIKPSKEIVLKIDKQLFREVIQNIISNAVKYNKKNGTVLLVIEKTKDKLKLEIANTGLIISKKDKLYIFDKFFRSEKAVKSDVEGTGLGLFVVRSYVEKWGGQIRLFSPKKFGLKSINGNKFEGTLFSIELPLSIKKINKNERKVKSSRS